MRFNLSVTEMVILGTVFSGIIGWGVNLESRVASIPSKVESAVVKAVEPFARSIARLPVGTIVAWHKPLASGVLPNGWAICDGTNGTPDLRGRFVRGKHDSYDTIGGKLHKGEKNLKIRVQAIEWAGETVKKPLGGPVRHQAHDKDWHPLVSQGTISAQDIVPPYHEAVFIMKIK